MEFLSYILIAIGAIMVYGSGIILKQFKMDNNNKAIIGIKLAGLVIAIIGMLRIFNVL